ncbi:CHAT domain-containing protein [Streptomyces massasporeus]|uniref:CHAT domain-containing protein n=1 Tax=Streptomyces massasporeus TaxID=67324 RepID=UPI0036CED8D4
MPLRHSSEAAHSGKPVDSAWGELGDAIRKLTFARGWDDVRRAFDQHPELLSDTGVELLEYLAEGLRKEGDPAWTRLYGQYLDLLVLARHTGVEAAITEMSGDDLPAELRAALASLSQAPTAADDPPGHIARIRHALESASPDSAPTVWRSLQAMLGDALLDDRTGDRAQNVEDALAALQASLSRQSRTARPILWAITMNDVARAHMERVRGNAEVNASHAHATFRQALDIFTGNPGPRIIAVDTERTLLLLATGTDAELRRAIDILRRLLNHLHGIFPVDSVVDLPRLARCVREVRLSQADEEAEDDAGHEDREGHERDEHLVVDVPNGSLRFDPARERVAVGVWLLAEYGLTGHGDTLRLALRHAEETARSTDASSTWRGEVLALLGNALWSYHDRVRDPRARAQAMDAHRQAAAVLPPDSPLVADCLTTLAEGLYQQHVESGDREDLDEAIALADRATALLPPDSPLRPGFLLRLGNYRWDRLFADGALRDLEAGLAALRLAEELTPLDAAGRLTVLCKLSAALTLRYERLGDLADLDDAIARGREALGHTPDPSPVRAAVLGELSSTLQGRYEATSRPADLDHAIEAAREALTLTPATAPERARSLLRLGRALNARYDLAQRPDDLTESVALIEQAVALSPPGTDIRDVALGALSMVMRDRYFRDGDLADLARSVEVARAGLALSRPGTPGRWLHLTGLGVALRQLYTRSGALSDLDEAIAQWREALEDDSPDEALPVALSGLAVALFDRHRHTGDRAHLQEAIGLARKGLDFVPPSSASYPNATHLLAQALLESFLSAGDPADLDEAATLLRGGIEADQGSVHGRMFLPSSLARVLTCRYEVDVVGHAADRDEARALFRRAVTAGLVICPDLARADSMAWGRWAARREAWSEAAEAYGYGLRAMEQLFRAQLTRATKESRLRDAQGLAVAAAHALARTGDATGAAVALERGRALLLSDALERGRVGLEQLSTTGHADLVERYRRGSAALAALERQTLASADGSGPAPAHHVPAHDPDVTDALRAARAELEAVITAIRRVDGYERFLDPPRFDDIRAAATTPLVYLAAAERTGFALLVTGDHVEVRWLPSLTEESLRARVESYLRAYGARASDAIAWENRLDEVTRWLWDAVMEPVVATLAPAGRAVLVPAGLLGLVPLHAAWREDASAPTGRRYALDDLLLTCVPNARARVAAAERAATASQEGLLAVADPHPVSARPLPAAGREVREALGHFTRTCSLGGDRATLTAVRDALGDYPVLHFACHGFAKVDQPLASGLLLAGDEPLTLRDLLRGSPLDARLAVLSACETAVPGVDLPDEVVSLPTGLLQAGAAGVVGSLWAVSDLSTMMLMARFYALWRSDGLDPPEALRRAQQWVRDTPNGAKRDMCPGIGELSGDHVPAGAKPLWEQARAHRSPSCWAAFVYVGE